MLRKFILYFVLLLTIPFHLFAYTPCASIANQSCQCDTENNTDPSGCNLYVCTAISPLTLSIDMTNYSTIISAIIAGQPFTVSTPACMAETGSTAWSAMNPNSYNLPINFQLQTSTTSNDNFPHATVFTLMQIPSTQNPNYYLGAQVSYCPCGDYTGGSGTGCSSSPENFPLMAPGSQTWASGRYNSSTGYPLNLGYCGDSNTTGGIVLQIYTPNDQIPAVGTYQVDLGLLTQGAPWGVSQKAILVKPTSTPGTFVNPSSTLCFQKKGQTCNTSTPAQFKP